MTSVSDLTVPSIHCIKIKCANDFGLTHLFTSQATMRRVSNEIMEHKTTCFQTAKTRKSFERRKRRNPFRRVDDLSVEH
jgi:hypothetical protein